jgi:hypothetical protein
MIRYITVSVEHPSITMLRIEVNGKVIKPKAFSNIIYFRVVNNDNVEIFFEPWKICPLIRFGHHLVNYGVAKINQWDHKLDFIADINWANKYFEQIVQNKREHLGSTGNYDAYLGIDSFHWNIVKRIEDKL